MAECMVTYGRGLDNFVWQEILEKIPNVNNLRHLGEGKIAFTVSLSSSTEKTEERINENISEGKEANEGILCEEKNEEQIRFKEDLEEDACRTVSKPDTQGTSEGQKREVTTAQTNTEEDHQWVAAVCHILRLRLVERVFTLLHCDDLSESRDAGAAHQDIAGKSNLEDILMDYENKLVSLVGSIGWDKLAVRLRGVRQHQAGWRQVWCQDAESCPGSLRKRRERQELSEKRMASESRGVMANFPKHHKTDRDTEEYFQKREARGRGNRRKPIDDFGSESSVKSCSNMCYHENGKVQANSVRNIETCNVSVKRECEIEDTPYIKRQSLHCSRLNLKADATTAYDHVTDISRDSPNPAVPGEHSTSQRDKIDVPQGETNVCVGEAVESSETNGATNMMNVVPENYKSLQDKLLMKKCGSPSPSCPEYKSAEAMRGNQDLEVDSNEYLSTFRVSGRVSGPHKHTVSVKWVNHVLSHQLNKTLPAWRPDWRQPLVDLYVNITASHFIVGAALTPRPLSLRPYVPHLTLRSTTSHLMARLARAPPEAIVLDPMCGGGSILLETAMNFDVSHVVAGDTSQQQLMVARCNLRSIQAPVTLMLADAQRLPLQDSSINTVLCDFPFGQKYKLTMEAKLLLARVLKEVQRLLVCEGRAVFLLSPKQHEALTQLTHDKTKHSDPAFLAGESLTLMEAHLVSLGETSAYVVVLVKEHSAFKSLKEEKEGML